MLSSWRRRKPIDDVPKSGPLQRSLETLDLMYLGLSAMLGSSIYVVCIVGAKEYAGPSLVISFVLAALFSLLVSFGYMEFASLIQRSGAIYQYMYATVGELMAFLMAFHKLLISVVIIGMCTQSWSIYLDSITKGKISQFLGGHLGHWGHAPFLLDHPDFIAAGLILILGLHSCLTVRISSKCCAFYTMLNLIMILTAITAFITRANLDNWNLSSDLPSPVYNYSTQVTTEANILIKNSTFTSTESYATNITAMSSLNYESQEKRDVGPAASFTTEPAIVQSTAFNGCTDNATSVSSTTVKPTKPGGVDDGEAVSTGWGGFFPYGWTGVLRGTSLCLLAFQGWDVIVVSPEEIRDPEMSIPVSITICISVVCLTGVLFTTVLTLLVPYWSLDSSAILPTVLETAGLPWVKYTLLIGLLSGLLAAASAAMFTLTRTVYAMATDGLLWSVCRRIADLTRVPVFTTITMAAFIALCAVFINFYSLLRCVTLATLLGFLMVNICVILLRYQEDEVSPLDNMAGIPSGESQGTTQRNNTPAKLELRHAKKGNNCSDSGNDADDAPPGVVIVDELSTLNTEQAGRIKPIFKEAQKVLIKLLTRSWVPVAVWVLLFLTVNIVLFVWMDCEGLLALRWCVTTTLLGLVFIVAKLLISICMHQQAGRYAAFRVPLMPVTPYAAMFLCVVFIVVNSDVMSWLGLLIATVLGVLFYCAYGRQNSKLGNLTTRFGKLEYSKLADNDCVQLLDEFTAEEE